MQIEEYRTRLEQFHAALNRQIYLHCSGAVGSLDLEGVHSDFSDLYSLETIPVSKSAWASPWSRVRGIICERASIDEDIAGKTGKAQLSHHRGAGGAPAGR